MQASEASSGASKPLNIRIDHTLDRFRVAVTDSGTGISAENLPQIFSLGFTTKKDGHGFGLHSARLAAAEMGGSLLVESEGPGKGATFTLELPFKPAAAVAAAANGLSNQ